LVWVPYGEASSRGLLKITGLFAKEPFKRDDILQKRPVILRSLQIKATPYRKQDWMGSDWMGSDWMGSDWMELGLD